MDKAWRDVYDFHEAFGVPVRDIPAFMPPERAQKRVLWMEEEIGEFIEAENIEEQADAMIDLIYFALGTLVEIGVQPQALFDIVHGANMQKLWPDGSPHYNSDGKVIKPSGWTDPEPLLRAELERQEKSSRRAAEILKK